jgi:hypothetical protein
MAVSGATVPKTSEGPVKRDRPEIGEAAKWEWQWGECRRLRGERAIGRREDGKTGDNRPVEAWNDEGAQTWEGRGQIGDERNGAKIARDQ